MILEAHNEKLLDLVGNIEGKWLVSLQKYCPDTVVWCFHNAHLIKHVLCMLYSRNCEYTTLFIVIHTFVQIYKEKKSGHISNTEKLLKRVMAKESCIETCLGNTSASVLTVTTYKSDWLWYWNTRWFLFSSLLSKDIEFSLKIYGAFAFTDWV